MVPFHLARVQLPRVIRALYKLEPVWPRVEAGDQLQLVLEVPIRGLVVTYPLRLVPARC